MYNQQFKENSLDYIEFKQNQVITTYDSSILHSMIGQQTTTDSSCEVRKYVLPDEVKATYLPEAEAYL